MYMIPARISNSTLRTVSSLSFACAHIIRQYDILERKEGLKSSLGSGFALLGRLRSRIVPSGRFCNMVNNLWRSSCTPLKLSSLRQPLASHIAGMIELRSSRVVVYEVFAAVRVGLRSQPTGRDEVSDKVGRDLYLPFRHGVDMARCLQYVMEFEAGNDTLGE